jgi:hypothetical protein
VASNSWNSSNCRPTSMTAERRSRFCTATIEFVEIAEAVDDTRG